ncbi:MAG TPA: hypothetical protein VKU84_17410, partial [Stellaceae bacterium]|nr:hypothetical protein [Stellaceae bacterium]
SVAWGDDPEGFGTLWPGAQVQAVDEQDRPLPPGEVGHLRVKTPWMCDRYVDNPEVSQRMFRNGWFYPGDIALVRADGALKVLGRADDFLNVGGQKVSPAELEATLLNHEIAGDVGVCSVLSADGVENLCVAVSGARHDDGALMDRIRKAVQPAGSFYIVKLGRIPRSANGKVERKLLKAEAMRSIRAGS